MSMQKTIGGDRLGAGKKMKVELHNYERSTHDMGYLWRSTMSAGTLVPFLTEVALPGDTFDINLDCDIKTHPTLGPLFGSYKVQLDIFQAPLRLYQGLLHNNKLGIGMKMSDVKLPQMTLFAQFTDVQPADNGLLPDIDNIQINPSHIFSYLNIRGVGYQGTPDNTAERDFNAVPFLIYWDTYKNYYANKQEKIGAMIFNESVALITTISAITINGDSVPNAPTGLIPITGSEEISITFAGGVFLQPYQLIFDTNIGPISLANVGRAIDITASPYIYQWKYEITGPITVNGWRYALPTELPQEAPAVKTFPLSRLDDMREEILRETQIATVFIVNDHATAGDPYALTLTWEGGRNPYLFSQQGLGLKTYQSDLFNNWIDTEFIDGSGGITELTTIDTTSGGFTIDELNITKKVYDMLNRIAISGGSYDDWMDAIWAHDRYIRTETPVYHGGLIKEIVFQEVVSNSESSANINGPQPLGTLAGKGVMAKKHKGGKITVRVDEPSYIMGIVSITPRIDYSQGNKWDTQLKTMDDFHKPALDQIGFQELITEQMAWWSTRWDGVSAWIQRSAGKQPAWLNYMTNVNQVRGNFAIEDNEMFMTLNRRYEPNLDDNLEIKDLTTYIDPVKYNHIFADTSIDAQNFWTQIAVDMTVRRKLSAKIMPNL